VNAMAAPIIDAMSGRLVSPIVVGRAAELATIADGLGAAREGTATTILLAGEAGVGKSRLVAEAMRLANEQGMQVMRGACVNIGSAGVPYGPIVEALRELQRELPPEEMAELVGAGALDLATRSHRDGPPVGRHARRILVAGCHGERLLRARFDVGDPEVRAG